MHTTAILTDDKQAFIMFENVKIHRNYGKVMLFQV